MLLRLLKYIFVCFDFKVQSSFLSMCIYCNSFQLIRKKYPFYIAIVSIATYVAAACNKPQRYASIPLIAYDTISKNQTFPLDSSLTVQFFFEDGEGDLDKVLYKDTRKLLIDANFDTLATPIIILKNNIATDVSGTILIRPFNSLPVLSPPTDSFVYIIKLVDKKGNESNEIITDTIIMN